MGSDRVGKDPNPIIDEGDPTSTAGITAVSHLCEIMEIYMTLLQPWAIFNRGWAPKLQTRHTSRQPGLYTFRI